MAEISLLEMLKAGVHFGHQQSRRHPKMEPYIFTTRGGVSIINLEKTRTALVQAMSFVRETVANGGQIIFVGTKRQARDIVQSAAQAAGMPYVIDRWIGGLLTNFNNVRQLIEKLARLKEERASGQHEKYTKKEQLDFEEEIERLEKLVGGLSSVERLPAAIYIVDLKNEKTAVHEAKKVGIPIVAMCDTNVNPAGIAYCIPANDDASKSIAFISEQIVEAVNDGRQQHDQRLAAAAKAAADEAAAALAAVNAEVTPAEAPA